MKKVNMLRKILMLILLSFNALFYSQANPIPHNLSAGNFSFTGFTSAATIVYPTSLQGWQTSINYITTPELVPSGANQNLVPNGTITTQGISNYGANGFIFLNTTSNGFRRVGSIALALNTTSRENISVTWTAADLTTTATRQMNLQLQYRIGNTGNFTNVASTLYTAITNSAAPAQNFSVILPAVCNDQAEVQLRWIYFESTGQTLTNKDAIRLDEIGVSSTAIPCYSTPSAVTLNSVNTNSANMSWTAPSPAPTSYDYFINTTGTAPNAATTPTGNTTSTNINLTTLNSNTTYYFWVRSNCGTAKSSWVSGGSFFTGYCIPSGNSGTYYIQNVTTVGGVSNINNTTGGSVSGYTDYSSQIVSNYEGNLTSITLNPPLANQTYYYYCWIDWNNDLDFNDANETIFAYTTYVTSYTGTISIPSGTALGNYRMRVASSFFGTLTSCGNAINGGEYEDYTFSVVAAPVCNVNPITYTEGFNSSFRPLCWGNSLVAVQTGSKISYVTSAYVGADLTSTLVTPFEGSHMIKYDSYSTVNGGVGSKERLTSVPLSSLGVTNGVDVEFYMYIDNIFITTFTNPTDNVQVQYSTDNGTTWINAGTTHNRFIPYDSGNWVKKTVNIPTALNNLSNFKVALLFTKDNGLNILVDKVTVKPTPRKIVVTPSSPVICSGNSVNLTATSAEAYTYTWSPATGLNTTTGSTVIATPSATTTYKVTGVNGQMTSTQYVTVSVNSIPTDISVNPTVAVVCDDTNAIQITASGGVLNNTTLINEDFNGAMTDWTFANTSTGGTPANSSWTQVTDEYIWRTTTFRSNDETSFVMSNSDSQNGGNTVSSITSPSFSTVGLNSFTINFYQFFRQVYDTDLTKVQASSDGGVTWTDLLSQNVTVGAANNFSATTITVDAVNFPTLLNVPNLLVRFLYESPNGWYWAIDNVLISGTGQRITWSPATGLYTDSAATVPYVAGSNASTVFAAPNGKQVYAVNAAVGVCNNSKTVDITFHNKKLVTDGNWSLNTNWFPAGVPDIDKCVNIPTGKSLTVDLNNATAKKLYNNGNVTVNANQSVTIKEAVINNSPASNFNIESDGNLIQIDNNALNSGSITVKRNAYIKKMDYTYWGSPVENQGLVAFSPNTLPSRIFAYRESNDLFFSVNLSTEPNFIAGKGYAIRTPDQGLDVNTYTTNAVFNGRFVGKPQNGNISIGVTSTLTPTHTDPGYNLISNPYPSNINFDDFWDLNQTALHKVAYFWTNNTFLPNQQGSSYLGNNYAIYNGTGGIHSSAQAGATGYQNTNVPNGTIKVGQGFIIKAKNTATTGRNTNTYTLNFNNSIRNADAGFFYNMNKNASLTVKDRFWISMKSPSNISNQILIGYIPGASNGFELDFDSELLTLGSDALFSQNQGIKLGIQARQYPLVSTDKVALGTQHYQNGNYVISIDKKEGIFTNGQKIYLKDKVLGKIIDLSEENYIFVASVGSTENRFEIVYQPENILSVDNISNNQVVIYKNGEVFVVKSPTDKIEFLEIFDAAGRLVYTVKVNGFEKEIPQRILLQGVYIVKIYTQEKIVSKKITR